MAGMTAGQGFQGTARADGVQLAVIAYHDGPCPEATTAPAAWPFRRRSSCRLSSTMST